MRYTLELLLNNDDFISVLLFGVTKNRQLTRRQC
jgi:hypothetical protein